ncbi:phage tail tape measure protein, partial [Aeromonas caviae]
AIMLAVNIAMYANPIGLIVAGIVLLIGAVAAVIYYWDDLKKTLADWGVFEAMTAMVDGAAAGWDSFMKLLADLSPFQLIGKAVDWLIDKLNMIPGVNIEFGSMPELAMPAISPLNVPVMPGAMNLQAPERQREVINAPLASYRQQEQSAVPSGGLGKQLIQANATATSANQKSSKVLSIGEV